MKNIKLIIVAIIIATAILMICMFQEGEFPSATELPTAMALQDALCATHQLPIEKCFFCNPALREPERLWCEEHERYENRCFICHPEIEETDRLWCEEHKLYEDECLFCHPDLRNPEEEPRGKETAISPETKTKSLSSGKLQCKEHGVLEEECGICHPALLDNLLPGQGLKVRLKSSESAVKAGVKTAIPIEGNSLTNLVFMSRITYNQNQLACITPLSGGVVKRVLADLGDVVSTGQVLVEIVSPDIAKAKSDYLSALENKALKELVFKREKKLVEKKISSQQEYEQALAEYQVAKNTTMMTHQQLLNYGLTEEQIRKVVEMRSSSSHLSILAPFPGTLIERNAVIGEVVKPGDVLFTLTDISTMWLELTVPEDRSSLLKVGDLVEATFDALPKVSVRGRLIWLASSIDEQSRMMKAHASVLNPNSLLKHGMFGKVRILPDYTGNGLRVPADTIHHADGKAFVFVKLLNDLYEIRRVSLGGKENNHVEILEGVTPQTEVVVTHSFTLKSEFLKSRLGAGCVDE
jgi:cobalt-zinc-cadmium efflux system membrane fusion protein